MDGSNVTLEAAAGNRPVLGGPRGTTEETQVSSQQSLMHKGLSGWGQLPSGGDTGHRSPEAQEALQSEG